MTSKKQGQSVYPASSSLTCRSSKWKTKHIQTCVLPLLFKYRAEKYQFTEILCGRQTWSQYLKKLLFLWLQGTTFPHVLGWSKQLMEWRCSTTGFTNTMMYTKDTFQKKGPISEKKKKSQIAEILQSEIYCRKREQEVEAAHITKSSRLRSRMPTFAQRQAICDLLFTGFRRNEGKLIPLCSPTTPDPLRLVELLHAIPPVLGRRRGLGLTCIPSENYRLWLVWWSVGRSRRTWWAHGTCKLNKLSNFISNESSQTNLWNRFELPGKSCHAVDLFVHISRILA